MENKAALCHSCRYFYVTWDRNFPYGCRAMNFKSRILPCREVRQAAGVDCLDYVEKDKPS